jgi:hypothetical protein
MASELVPWAPIIRRVMDGGPLRRQVVNGVGCTRRLAMPEPKGT